MELVKQEKLHFKDSKSDKIYEVELYYIQKDEYVVNFRYGRRGSTPREGTKTVFPIHREKAEKVFSDLVTSKTKKGYKIVQSYSDEIGQLGFSELPVLESSKASHVVLSYLTKKANDHQVNTNWKLSRILWRAGELEIEESITVIKELLPNLQPMEMYSAVWTLGRLGTQEALAILKTIPHNPKDLHYRILIGALINCGDNNSIELIGTRLSHTFKPLYDSKSYDDLKSELEKQISQTKSNSDFLLSLYYLGIQDEQLKQVLCKIFADIAIVPGIWKYLRYIYKVAEMIKDGETFGQIARLANLRDSYFRKNKWSDTIWLDGKSVNVENALSGDIPQLAFSQTTKEYFIRRTLRRLRKAGVDKMESYCELASGILLAYEESDAQKEYEIQFHNYDWESRTSTTETHTYPTMAHVPYFYYILFARGDRMEITSKLNRFYSTSGIGEWTRREDSFPELWNAYPRYSIKILALCKNRDAMNFAFKVLKDRSGLDSLLSEERLIQMVSSPFEEVIEFSLDYIEKRYILEKPNEELIIKMIASNNEKAINLTLELLNKHSEQFTSSVHFIYAAISSPIESIHLWLRKNITEHQLDEIEVASLIEQCLTDFKRNPKEHQYGFTQESLVQIFQDYLKKLDSEKILELIDHPLLEVKLFGAKLINLNDRKPEEWPDTVLINLLSSENRMIREEGMDLFSKLMDEQIIERTDFIIRLASNDHQNLRLRARKIIKRLSKENAKFGESILMGLYQVLSENNEQQEIGFDVYETIEQSLLPYSYVLKSVLDEMLLSNNREVHLLTSYCLKDEDLSEWPIWKIARLGAHDMNAIRLKAHLYFDENVDKVKYATYEAINILDTDWEDTHHFGRDFFENHFTENEWDPDLIIAVCDSVRPETQEFGTRMLGKYFTREEGAKYLKALSEHPDPTIELYRTNYLSQYALNNKIILDSLKPYFIRILSAINSRRAAKHRAFDFLKRQSEESEEATIYVAEILNQLVGTIVVQENQNYVSLLHSLKQKHPALNINIEKVPLEIR